MTVRLVVADDAFALEAGPGDARVALARLDGGADALIDPSRTSDAPGLERAIERAEDWLMPHAGRLRDEVLDVVDATGRLDAGLRRVLSVGTRAWTVDEVESMFARLVDLALARVPAPVLREHPRLLADVLLLRELAHHGRVRGLRLA